MLQALQGVLQWQFGRRIPKESASKELFGRRQHDSEKLGAFMADLRCLIRQSYSEFTTEVQEELALWAFLRRLQTNCPCEHVRLAAPGSLMVALKEAE